MTLPKIKLLTGLPIADPWSSFYSAIYDGDLLNPTSTQIVVSQAGGNRIVFHGNFTVVGNDVTGGTVTGFDVFAGSTKVAKATNFSFAAGAFFDALQQIQIDTQPFFNLFNGQSTKIVGSNLDDYVGGGDVKDVILGRKGNDQLYGADGNDVIKGGPGNDFISGEGGFNKLKGDAGKDVFHFFIDPSSPPIGYDKLMDFSPGEDVIGLSFFMPGGPPVGELAPSRFHKGTAATSSDQLVIYDKKHGDIFIDLDGSGPKPQFLLATVADGTKLHHDDFYVGGLMLISDARAKQDIEPVGRTRGGTTIYRFRYIFGGPLQIGVIAQEVERINPAAVIVRPDGLRMVNYAKVT